VYGFTSDDVSTGNVTDQTGDYQLSVRTRHQPRQTITAELNAFSGITTQNNSSLDTKGVSDEVNGQLTYLAGKWMTNDLYAQVTGNTANTLLKRTGLRQSGKGDLGQTYRGNMALFPQSPASFSTDFT